MCIQGNVRMRERTRARVCVCACNIHIPQTYTANVHINVQINISNPFFSNCFEHPCKVILRYSSVLLFRFQYNCM